VNAQNYDILQLVQLPVNDDVQISVNGTGEAIGQIVERYNLPAVDATVDSPLKVDVKYDATEWRSMTKLKSR